MKPFKKHNAQTFKKWTRKIQATKIEIKFTIYLITNGEKGLLEIHFFEKFDKVAKLGKAAEDV